MSRRVVTVLLLAVIVLPVARAAAGGPRRPRTVSEAMGRQIDHPVIRGPMRDVIAELEKLAGASIVVDWRSLKDVGVDPTRVITLDAPAATVTQLLDLTLDQAATKDKPLEWKIVGDMALVSTRAKLFFGGMARYLGPVPTAAAGGQPRARPAGGRVGGRVISFESLPLGDVISFFRDVSGVNFHANWRALEAVGVNKDTPVTLKAQNIALGRALDLVMDQLVAGGDRFSRVYWVIDGGVVHISTGQELNREMRVKTFDVADLLMVIRDFPGRSRDRNNQDGDDNGSLFGDDDDDNNDDNNDEQETRAQREQKLIDVIKDTVGPEMWRPEGLGTVRIWRNQLIVSQSLLGYKLMERAVGG